MFTKKEKDRKKKLKKRELRDWYIPGFPGRLLFFLMGGCELVFDPLLLFVVVVVEVWEFGLWRWPSISGGCCLTTTAAYTPVVLIFSVEKLPLSQLVMFDIEEESVVGKDV